LVVKFGEAARAERPADPSDREVRIKWPTLAAETFLGAIVFEGAIKSIQKALLVIDPNPKNSWCSARRK